MISTIRLKPARDVRCKGDSIWSDTKGKIVRVSSISFNTYDDGAGPYINGYIEVKHNHSWEIYTDSGFEKGISKIASEAIARKITISFTEQGMQERRCASMEFDGNDKMLLNHLNVLQATIII